MSLYQVQKLLFELNRDPGLQDQYFADKDSILENYKLDVEETDALAKATNIGTGV